MNELLKETRELLDKEESISDPLKSAVGTLLEVVKLMSDRLGLNSKNSSKPLQLIHLPEVIKRRAKEGREVRQGMKPRLWN